MIRNNDNDHFISVVGSLDKSYLHAKTYGKLNTSEIYILNTIYNILNNFTNLTASQKNSLSLLYNHIYYNSSNICKTYSINSNLINSKKSFIQNALIKARTIPSNSSSNIIYYWQEEDLNTTIEDIIPLTYNSSFFTSKSSDTYDNFENIGKTINYSNVGRIGFYATESDNKSFIVTDILNNDVTNIFDIIYLSDSNATLFVSKNFYSNGNIFFKFKQTTELNIIFDTQFNNIFQ